MSNARRFAGGLWRCTTPRAIAAVLLLQVQAGTAWAETVTLTPPYAESSTFRSCEGQCSAEATADHTTGELTFNVATAPVGTFGGSARAYGTIVGTHTLEAESNVIDYRVNVHITELLTEGSTGVNLWAEAEHTACSQCSDYTAIVWGYPDNAVIDEDVSLAFTLINNEGGPVPQGTIRILVRFDGHASTSCNILPPGCGPPSSGSGRATVTSIAATWNNNPAAAHPGPLDPTFDTDGRVTTDFGSGGANAVAIQGDGKIVAAGRGGLARYNTDGSLDPTFGGDGIVATSSANAVAIQEDGKIVAAGTTTSGDYFDWSSYFALARYNTDGSLDPTFGGDGIVTTDFNSSESYGNGDEGRAVAIQKEDGKIVAAGVVGSDSVIRVGPVRRRDFALARYNTDGSLDPTFDIDGKVTTDFAGQNDEANAVAIQEDGKIVATGSANPHASSNTSSLDDFALARYTTIGTLDPTFGVVGKVTTDFVDGDDQAYGVAIQDEGKIVAAGGAITEEGTVDFALARYDTLGSLDSTFDGDGKVTTGEGLGAANGVAIQGDGKIVAAGSGLGDFGLARYNTDGSLDPTFGVVGKVNTDFGGADQARDIAIQKDGKIVAAGVALGDFALARYRIHNEADLSITKTGPSGRVPTGRDMTYTLAVTNKGPDSASGVTVTDQLPPTATFVSATATQGSCGESTGTVSCSLGAMSSGAIVTIEIVVRPTTAGRITNSASVASPTPDSVQANNADSVDTSICRITSRRSSIPCG